MSSTVTASAEKLEAAAAETDAAVASLTEGLSHTKLKGDDASSSEDESAGTTRRVLSFADRGLKLDTAELAAEVTAALQSGPPDLAEFELSGNTIGIPAAGAIGDALGRHAATLRRLLWKDTFTGRLKTEIGPALTAMTRCLASPDTPARLVEIDLCDIAFGPNGVVGVTELLASPACFSLRILRMNNEGLGHQGCQLLTQALNRGLDASEAAGRPLRLRLFSAGRNRLENVGAKMLAGPLSRMGSLRHLALYQNGIGIHGPEGIEALASIVSANAGLRTLNLMDNSIKPDGAQLLAEPLRRLPRLVELNLADCLLLSEGAQTIADALDDADHPRLAEVVLSGNEIGREAALALAAAAAAKPGLRRLDLNANQIGPDGIQLIRRHMEAALSTGAGASVLASFSDDEGEGDGENDDDEAEEETEETGGDFDEHRGEGEEDEDQEGEVEAATAGLAAIGGGGSGSGGGINGNRSLFDDLLPNASSCSLFGGGSAKTASTGAGGVAAFSFKAAMNSAPPPVKTTGGNTSGGDLFRPSALKDIAAATSAVTAAGFSDEAAALERLLATPAAFKLDSLGDDPGPALLRAAQRLPPTGDSCQRLVSAAAALCQAAAEPQFSRQAESAAAALLEAGLRADVGSNLGRVWVQAVLTETGLIKSESLRNKHRTCNLSRTAPFWRGVSLAVTACSGALRVEQRQCLATCLSNLWPSAAGSGAAESAKRSLVDTLLATSA